MATYGPLASGYVFPQSAYSSRGPGSTGFGTPAQYPGIGAPVGTALRQTSAPQGQVLATTDTNFNQGPSIPSGPDYSGYYSELDNIMNSLGGQQTNLVNQATEQTNQQQNNLDLQNTQGNTQLDQYQTKSLKDIGSSIASGFQAGNNMLGSMGAGDSSAANQYAYALSKEGSKQRGNVMADVQSRKQGLQQTYNIAKNNLQSGLNAKISEIAQWFSEQQNALKGQKADIAKQKADQVYQFAVNQLGIAQHQAASRQTALDGWIANNATTLQQAQSQMQQVAQNNPVPNMFNTTPQATNNAPRITTNGGLASSDQNSLFGSPRYNYL